MEDHTFTVTLKQRQLKNSMLRVEVYVRGILTWQRVVRQMDVTQTVLDAEEFIMLLWQKELKEWHQHGR